MTIQKCFLIQRVDTLVICTKEFPDFSWLPECQQLRIADRKTTQRRSICAHADINASVSLAQHTYDNLINKSSLLSLLVLSLRTKQETQTFFLSSVETSRA